MGKPKNYYIRYKLAELENYVKHPESCVKKVHKVEKLTFGSNVTQNFKESILKILSRKIGKYDRNLEGVVLDFRNTKILDIHTGIRYDSAYSVINVETNFYIFSPQKNLVVDGIVKHINIQKMETIISVVIYRVFSVKVTFKGCIKQCDVHHNKEIKIRIKEFHFDNEIPYIEAEMVYSSGKNTRKLFDDVLDSGISESSIHNENRYEHTDDEDMHELDQSVRIKQERESSTESATSKRRRRNATEEDNNYINEPPTKRIKQEPVSDDEEISHNHIHIKQEKIDSDADSSSNNKTNDRDTLNENSSRKALDVSQNSTETSVKKKKKKKKHNVEDDFESSLQMLLNSSLPIKTEKD